MFLHVSVCPQGVGVCGRGKGRAWQGVQIAGGACVAGGHAWQGGRAWQGVCVVGGHACHALPQQTLRDTVNERAVRILLECILVVVVILLTHLSQRQHCRIIERT